MSCTAVTSHHVGKSERVLCLLWWKVWTHKAKQGQGACRCKGLAEKPDPLSNLGKRHTFFSSYECSVTRWSCGSVLSKGKLLMQEMQAVPVGWSTSAITHFIPARKGEEHTRPCNNPLCSGACTVSAHDSSACTTPQAAQLERTSLNPCTGKALSALHSLMHSGLFCPRGNGIGKRLRKPLTPQPPEGHQWP